MKAAIRNRYDEPMQIVDMPIAEPKSNEVQIRIHATTVNRTGHAVKTGAPYIMRAFVGLTKPKNPITGVDLAGEVVAVGDRVVEYEVGDKVWALNDEGLGSHATHINLAVGKYLDLMPPNISYQQAVASLEGAHYAFNGLRKMDVKDGMKILLNGATGAIGSALLQFLKVHKVYITAVCHPKDFDLITSLGADKLIDYTSQNVMGDDEKYDYIIDYRGEPGFFEYKKLLKPNGVVMSSELGAWVQFPLLALVTPIFGGRKVIFPIPSKVKRSMEFIKEQIVKNNFKAVIDRSYPLKDIEEAFEFVGSGMKTGNVVIEMGE